MIKGAIFDVDGTLLDSMPVWTNSGEKFLASQGIKAEAGLGHKLFSMTVPMGAEYLRREYQLDMSLSEIERGISLVVADFYFNDAPLKPGALELLETLKTAGVKMAVATSTDRYYIEKAFERLDLTKYFEAIFTCTEVGASKSQPDIFFQAVKALKTPVEETWVFEDGLYSIKTAKKEGFPIVGIYDKVSEKDQAEIKANSTLYLKDLRDFTLI